VCEVVPDETEPPDEVVPDAADVVPFDFVLAAAVCVVAVDWLSCTAMTPPSAIVAATLSAAAARRARAARGLRFAAGRRGAPVLSAAPADPAG
jgi:hypothetical protein